MEMQIGGFSEESRRQERDTRHCSERREGNQATKSPSLLRWYYILRAHHRWTVFQAIRYALWPGR